MGDTYKTFFSTLRIGDHFEVVINPDCIIKCVKTANIYGVANSYIKVGCKTIAGQKGIMIDKNEAVTVRGNPSCGSWTPQPKEFSGSEVTNTIETDK